MNQPLTECKTYGPQPIGVAAPISADAYREAADALRVMREYAECKGGWIEAPLDGGGWLRVAPSAITYRGPLGSQPVGLTDAQAVELLAVAG